MSIPHTVGAQQGNKMAPILLLFVTQAISESLKDKWEKEWGLTCPRSHIMPIPSIKKTTEHGCLLTKSTTRKATFSKFHTSCVSMISPFF
jgi:hypothetical protein